MSLLANNIPDIDFTLQGLGIQVQVDSLFHKEECERLARIFLDTPWDRLTEAHYWEKRWKELADIWVRRMQMRPNQASRPLEWTGLLYCRVLSLQEEDVFVIHWKSQDEISRRILSESGIDSLDFQFSATGRDILGENGQIEI